MSIEIRATGLRPIIPDLPEKGTCLYPGCERKATGYWCATGDTGTGHDSHSTWEILREMFGTDQPAARLAQWFSLGMPMQNEAGIAAGITTTVTGGTS